MCKASPTSGRSAPISSSTRTASSSTSKKATPPSIPTTRSRSAPTCTKNNPRNDHRDRRAIFFDVAAGLFRCYIHLFPRLGPRCPVGLIFRESRVACHFLHGSKPGPRAVQLRNRRGAIDGPNRLIQAPRSFLLLSQQCRSPAVHLDIYF